MKLSQQICILMSTLILSQYIQANELYWTAVHFGECTEYELARGFKVGMGWYNGVHTGHELREVCFQAPRVDRLESFNRTNSSQAFIASGTTSIAWPEAERLAKEQMWKNAQKLCKVRKAVRISKINIFDVGTFIAVRAQFKCM